MAAMASALARAFRLPLSASGNGKLRILTSACELTVQPHEDLGPAQAFFTWFRDGQEQATAERLMTFGREGDITVVDAEIGAVQGERAKKKARTHLVVHVPANYNVEVVDETQEARLDLVRLVGLHGSAVVNVNNAQVFLHRLNCPNLLVDADLGNVVADTLRGTVKLSSNGNIDCHNIVSDRVSLNAGGLLQVGSLYAQVADVHARYAVFGSLQGAVKVECWRRLSVGVASGELDVHAESIDIAHFSKGSAKLVAKGRFTDDDSVVHIGVDEHLLPAVRASRVLVRDSGNSHYRYKAQGLDFTIDTPSVRFMARSWLDATLGMKELFAKGPRKIML